jgi:hypothetical protein
MWARTRELLWVRVEDGTDIAGSRNVALRCLHLVWRLLEAPEVTGHGR